MVTGQTGTRVVPGDVGADGVDAAGLGMRTFVYVCNAKLVSMAADSQEGDSTRLATRLDSVAHRQVHLQLRLQVHLQLHPQVHLQVRHALTLTSALLLAVALEAGQAATHEVGGEVAALGIGHAPGRHCRVVTLVDVCNRAANWPY